MASNKKPDKPWRGDWQAERDDERAEIAEERAQRERDLAEVRDLDPAFRLLVPLRERTKRVYLVQCYEWYYNDSFYESSETGQAIKAFTTREKAEEYMRTLPVEHNEDTGTTYRYHVVEMILEE